MKTATLFVLAALSMLLSGCPEGESAALPGVSSTSVDSTVGDDGNTIRYRTTRYEDGSVHVQTLSKGEKK